MSFIWHGLNRDPRKRANQCYYEASCLLCILRAVAYLVHLRLRYVR